MKLKSARCGQCRKSLTLAPKILEFKPVPLTIECPSCHNKMTTDFDIKYTYYYYLAWKLCIILSVPYFWSASMNTSTGSPWVMLLASVVFGGGLLGIIISYILAFPVMFVMDLIGSLTDRPEGQKVQEERFKKFLDGHK